MKKDNMIEEDRGGPTALQLFNSNEEAIYTIETVVRMTHTPRRQIAVYCRHGLISPVAAPEREGWLFDLESIRALRRIEKLRTVYGVNLTGLRVIMELLREVEQLREEARALRRS